MLSLEILLTYIAANVRQLRMERGLTQESLAEAAGLDLRFLQEIESGRQKISLAALVALSNALEVAPGRLLRPATMPAVKRGRPRKAKRP